MQYENDRRISILLVDDQPLQMTALSDALLGQGFAVTGYTDAVDALGSLAASRYDLMLADLIMPGMDGIALIEAAQRIAPAMGCIAITAGASVPSAVDAMRVGALDYVLKPFDISALSATLQRAMGVCRLRIEKEAAQQSLRADLDHLSDVNRSLEASRSNADLANEAKSRFVATMSHELRTPLNSIIGFAHILNSPKMRTSEAQRLQFSGHILNSAKHLLALIDEVLDLAKLEAMTDELILEQVDLRELLRECLTMLQPMCMARDINTRCTIKTELRVHADRLKLKQAILNLLSNSVKYNRPAGNLWVEVEAMENASVRITVNDNGIGISKENLSRLFRPFDRLNQASGKEQGSGLGLVTTKKLVEKMHGRMGVASELGQGSVFWIELAHAVTHAPAG